MTSPYLLRLIHTSDFGVRFLSLSLPLFNNRNVINRTTARVQELLHWYWKRNALEYLMCKWAFNSNYSTSVFNIVCSFILSVFTKNRYLGHFCGLARLKKKRYNFIVFFCIDQTNIIEARLQLLPSQNWWQLLAALAKLVHFVYIGIFCTNRLAYIGLAWKQLSLLTTTR